MSECQAFNTIPMEFIGTKNITSLNLFESIIENQNDNWHSPESRNYHISSLALCTKLALINSKKESSIDKKTRGTFHLGKILHKETEEKYISKYSFGVAEFPIVYKLFFDNNGKEDFITIKGKIDLLDFENQRLIDIKSIKPEAFKYIRKDGAKFPHVIQTILYFYLWNKFFSTYKIKSAGVLYINKADYTDLYCPIDLNYYNPERIYNKAMKNLIDTDRKVLNLNYNASDWICRYCSQKVNCKKNTF